MVWTPAVNVKVAEWTYDKRLNGGWIRDLKITPMDYPIDDKRWHERIGVYTYMAESEEIEGNQIVEADGVIQSLTPPFTLSPLGEEERNQSAKQTDKTYLIQTLTWRLESIMKDAATGQGLDPKILNTPKNVKPLLKPLRVPATPPAEKYALWNSWKEGVMATIKRGAEHLAASLAHWQEWLYPEDAAQVKIVSVVLTGSDLNEEGLGAVIVNFKKPVGPAGSTFADQTDFKVVIKPEDRALEKALFGAEDTSLASQVNEMVGLTGGSEIQKIKMETHTQYGSIIEFVEGTLAKELSWTQETSPGMKEAIAFALLGGITDVHKENVIWKDGKPYLIDADNALNKQALDEALPGEAQSGFFSYDATDAVKETKVIRESPEESTSEIVKALLRKEDKVPLIRAVRGAFAGKGGRVVPIATSTWGSALGGYWTLKEGTSGDKIPIKSRRAMAQRYSEYVPQGKFPKEPGLLGEVGGAESSYQIAKEEGQIKADWDRGKIPFYNYDFTSGSVTHNGQSIWAGQTLDVAIETLLKKFPEQRSFEF